MLGWQLADLSLSSGGALSDAEREQIMIAVRTEVAVCAQWSRLFEGVLYDLKTGEAKLAARGMDDRMCVDQAVFYARVAKGVDGIKEEVAEFSTGSPEDLAEFCEMVKYVMNERTSEKQYPNGIRDHGRKNVDLMHFLTDPTAQEARLNVAEAVSARLYSTSVYKPMNNPLRDDERYAKREPVPLPVMSYWAASAIKKLRAVKKADNGAVVVWRGMRNVRVTKAFMKEGGTELAFMSTTKELRVAVRYSLSRHSLLFKIVAPSFMSLGAELQWLSAFPGEAEVLFPPLTYLKPTGRTDRVDAVDRYGHPVAFTIIEVTPYIG